MKLRLWKENKLDGEYAKEYKEIKEEYVKSEYFKNVLNDHYNLEYGLTLFIGAKDGLNSSMKNEEFSVFYESIHASLIEKLKSAK